MDSTEKREEKKRAHAKKNLKKRPMTKIQNDKKKCECVNKEMYPF